MKASIRKAIPSDAKQIAVVIVEAWRAAYRGLLPDSTLDGLSASETAARWAERIAKGRGHIFVAERDGRVMGVMACGSSEDEDSDRARVGEIHVIYVHPDEWRQGHGTALEGEALRCLRKDGFDEVILWVLRGNARAMRFYEAQGFAADGATKVKRRADGTEMPVVRYHRSIG